MVTKSVTEKLTFDQWMRKVDSFISLKLGFGLTSSDLPDCCYWDWYDDGVKPASAASRAIRYAKSEGDIY